MKAPILKRRNLLGAGALVAAAGLTGTARAATTGASKTSVSVFDFGAVGDGVTDDSAAFSAALKWSADNSQMVIVPGYNYAIAHGISWSSTHDVGANWGFISQGALLKSSISNGDSVISLTCNHTVRYLKLIGSLSIQGSGGDSHGIFFYCGGQNIFFYNLLVDGLSVERVGATGLVFCGNVFESTIQNSYFQDCGGNGVTMTDTAGGVVSAVNMVNCFFNQNGNFGLSCTNSDATYGGAVDVRVYGGYCRQNRSYGFYYNNGNGGGSITQVGFENNCTGLQPGDPNGAHVYALTSMNMRDCSGYNMFGGATYLLRGWFLGLCKLDNCGQDSGGQVAATGASRLVQVNGNSNGLVYMKGCAGGVAIANGNGANWQAVNCTGPSPLGNLNPAGTMGTV
jgi:hypothetical protein